MPRPLKMWNPERNWSYKPFNRKWRKRSPVFLIMPIELAGTVALLVLFAIAQPDQFRTQLWRIGYVWGFNSNPNVVLYAKANHDPAPHLPFVWTLALTNYNVGISVLSLFVLLAKLIGFIMRVWTPIVSLFFSFAMTVMYAVSVYGQMGPDYSDPRYPSPIAWYIRYGCWHADGFANDAVGSCRMAKGTFAATVIQLAIYVACLAYAVYNMIPTKEEKEEMRQRKLHGSDNESDNGSPVDKVVYEMQPPKMQQQYEMPFTPRTQAFNALERKLPLRS
ncbi:hypothetical protein SLS53_004049 [Cytospora paraplurivora]|uniref:Uncharacterized protein n=1 Tax=Cytospora paraplurivora TaxID=2898453 RepID=A0AAN9UBY0_9PEZI